MTHEYPRFTITNSHHHPTKPQPVTVTVPEKVEADLILGTTDLGQSSPFQKVLGDSDGSSTTFIGILVPHDGEVLSLHDPDPGETFEGGIVADDNTLESDAVCHLDTGYLTMSWHRQGRGRLQMGHPPFPHQGRGIRSAQEREQRHWRVLRPFLHSGKRSDQPARTCHRRCPSYRVRPRHAPLPA